MEALSGIALFLVIIGVILVILWIILPFTVGSIQSEIKKTNKLMREILIELRKLNGEVGSTQKNESLNQEEKESNKKHPLDFTRQES